MDVDCSKNKDIIVKPKDINYGKIIYSTYIVAKNTCHSAYIYLYDTCCYIVKSIDNKLREHYSTKDDEAFICDICMANKKDIVLVPCGHTLCKECRPNIEKCHFCNSKINGHLEIYI